MQNIGKYLMASDGNIGFDKRGIIIKRKGKETIEVPVSAFDQHGKHFVIFLYIVRCDQKFYVLPSLTAR